MSPECQGVLSVRYFPWKMGMQFFAAAKTGWAIGKAPRRADHCSPGGPDISFHWVSIRQKEFRILDLASAVGNPLEQERMCIPFILCPYLLDLFSSHLLPCPRSYIIGSSPYPKQLRDTQKVIRSIHMPKNFPELWEIH